LYFVEFIFFGKGDRRRNSWAEIDASKRNRGYMPVLTLFNVIKKLLTIDEYGESVNFE